MFLSVQFKLEFENKQDREKVLVLTHLQSSPIRFIYAKIKRESSGEKDKWNTLSERYFPYTVELKLRERHLRKCELWDTKGRAKSGEGSLPKRFPLSSKSLAGPEVCFCFAFAGETFCKGFLSFEVCYI